MLAGATNEYLLKLFCVHDGTMVWAGLPLPPLPPPSHPLPPFCRLQAPICLGPMQGHACDHSCSTRSVICCLDQMCPSVSCFLFATCLVFPDQTQHSVWKVLHICPLCTAETTCIFLLALQGMSLWCFALAQVRNCLLTLTIGLSWIISKV